MILTWHDDMMYILQSLKIDLDFQYCPGTGNSHTIIRFAVLFFLLEVLDSESWQHFACLFSGTKLSQMQVSLLRWTACNSSSTRWDIEIQQRPKFGPFEVWSLYDQEWIMWIEVVCEGSLWSMSYDDLWWLWWLMMQTWVWLANLRQGFCSFFLYCPGGPRRQNAGSKTGFNQAWRDGPMILRCEHQMQPECRQPKTRCGHLSKLVWGFP